MANATTVEHLVSAVKDARKRLDGRMSACEKAQEEYITSLTDEEVMESESHCIAIILEAYYKACDRAEIFISQNSAEGKKATPDNKPGTTSGI